MTVREVYIYNDGLIVVIAVGCSRDTIPCTLRGTENENMNCRSITKRSRLTPSQAWSATSRFGRVRMASILLALSRGTIAIIYRNTTMALFTYFYRRRYGMTDEFAM